MCNLNFISSWSLSRSIHKRLKDLIMLTVVIKQLNLLICVFMVASSGGRIKSSYLFGSWLFPFAARGIRSDHHYLPNLMRHLVSVLRSLRSLHLITLIACISFPFIILIKVVEYIWRKFCITFFGGYQPCNFICIILFVKRHLLIWFSKRL